MSLDDFFNKRSKKKAKIITTSALLQQITDTNPLPQPETETNNDLIPSVAAESDEWEPIQNDIAPDFSDLSLHDLEEEENEDAVVNDVKDTSKSNGNEVAWKNKPRVEEEPKKVEVEEPPKPSIYLSAAFRKCKALPNVDSMDEFPTLDAVKDKPAKKVEKPVEPVDNSWTDVQRGSSRRREVPSNAYAPPGYNRSEGRSRYVPPTSGGFPPRSGVPSERPGFNAQSSSTSSTSGWTRGSTIKQDEVISRASFAEQRGSGGFERKPGVVPAAKPYVPPSLRNVHPVSQSNRFAQLDNS
ncbi:hypothetical protein ACTXT7_016462 [Hymenolepis weldensis]